MLAGCLEACEGLGFHTEEVAEGAVSFPVEACQYVDASHRLLALQTEVEARGNANLFGGLLDSAKLAKNVSRLLKHGMLGRVEAGSWRCLAGETLYFLADSSAEPTPPKPSFFLSSSLLTSPHARVL